jgi:hypothetical protein
MSRQETPRTVHPIALTGPAAAHLYDLDGFRDVIWPQSYATPYAARGGHRIIRTRNWIEPHMRKGELVVPLITVLRHLNAFPQFLENQPDGINPRDRIELAVEHARRLGTRVDIARDIPSNSRNTGDRLLREVRRLSGNEPPTDSYAETMALQWFRSVGYSPFRQVDVRLGGKQHRIDFAISLKPRVRPSVARPNELLLCELDSRGFHNLTLEQDTARRNAFARAEFHHVELMPNEIRDRPQRALATIEGAIRRTGRSRQTTIWFTPERQRARITAQKHVA